MHKRKIMNYHQNEVNRVIAAQILADRAGLDNLQKEKLVERAKKIEIKDSKKNSFIRLANKRVSKAIKSIQLVKNLSNKRSYSYSIDEIKKLEQSLKEVIVNLDKSFKKKSSKKLKSN
tara:strand:+ start:104 stop:457 length:354 start_codon:yes stop_codon:yes gene_type:complete